MTNEEKHDAVVKSLTDSLNKITESVIKKLDEEPVKKPKDDEATPPDESKGKVEKNVDKKDDQENKNQNSEVTELIKNLQTKIDALEIKLDKGVKTAEDVAADNINKKKDEIQAGMVELVKNMGLDPENLDLNFVIKEKKKSEVDDNKSDGDKFSKENESDEDDFEKQFENLSDEERTEALNTYFKGFISK